MNFNFKAFLACFLAATTCFASAQNKSFSEVSVSFDDDTHAQSGYSAFLGLNYFNFDYAEDVVMPLKSTEKGSVPGVNLIVNLDPTPEELFGRFNFDYASPTLNYDGSTQSGRPLTFKGKHTLVNLEGNIGMNLMSYRHKQSRIRGYTGIGYHNWQRGLDAGSSGVAAINETYSWFYLPIGFTSENNLNDTFALNFETIFKLPYAGKMKAHLSKLSPDLNNPEINLENGPALKLQTTFIAKITKRIRLSLSPWFEYSTIRASDSVEVFVNNQPSGTWIFEPGSRTYQYGSILAIGAEL